MFKKSTAMSLGTSPTTVDIWRPNKSNTHTATHTPCGFLVQNTKCPNPGCDFSHDMLRVRWWQNKHASKPCRWGETCPHFMNGNCLYYHAREHTQSEVINRDKIITQDLQFVERLDVTSLVAEQEVGIFDKGDLASFNKISDDEIAVPGCPPRFYPITEPLAVTLDWHNLTLQPNFARYTHTFEPLLKSLEVTDPTFDVFSAADIVSNASNLRKLFHIFLNKKKVTERFDLEWRYETLFLSKWTGDPSLRSSLGHGTGFEKETCRYSDRDDEVLRNSSSHHRVVWYTFAGLECVIQSEVDGYYCDCEHPRAVLSPPKRPQEKQQKPLDIETSEKGSQRRHRRKISTTSTSSSSSSSSSSRSPPNWNWNNPRQTSTSSTNRSRTNSNISSSSQFSRFSSLLSLDDPGDTPEFISSSSRQVIASPTLKVHLLPGRNIPSPCLIEIKTHKANNRPMFAPEAQLYFCRRTKLSMAQHKDGVFRPPPQQQDPSTSAKSGDEEQPGRKPFATNGGSRSDASVQDKTEDLTKWERENQPTLGKVAAFLRLLTGKMRDRAAARRWREGKGSVQGMSVVIEGDGRGRVTAGLYLRGQNGEGRNSLLPDD
ncbi:hypothetical protein V8F20_009519, partial [Naviculisporaceae sp. PSN 640]